MPIAFDASTTSNQGAGAGPFSFAHVVAAGENRCLTVHVNAFEGDYVSSVTYNGVAMTLIAKQQNTAEACFTYLFRLVAPATGSNTVTITLSSNAQIYATAESFLNVDQTTPVNGSHATTSTSATQTFTIVTTVANCWLVGGSRNNAGAITAGANTVVRDTIGGIGSGSFDSNGARATGSNDLIVTNTGSTTWAGVAAALAPSASGSMLMVF